MLLSFKSHKAVPRTRPVAYFECLLGAYFMAMSALVMAMMLHGSYVEFISKGWPAVPGRIVKSEVHYRDYRGMKGRGSYAEIIYEYQVNGSVYTARESSSEMITSAAHQAKLKTLNYPLGAEVVVHADPQDPQRSTLHPGLEGWNLKVLVTLGFLLFTFLGVKIAGAGLRYLRGRQVQAS